MNREELEKEIELAKELIALKEKLLEYGIPGKQCILCPIVYIPYPTYPQYPYFPYTYCTTSGEINAAR